jgi:excisionase family DNA binding protein
MHAPLRPLLVPIDEARRLLGIGRTKVYGLIADGRLRAVRIDRRTLIRFADLEKLAEPLAQEGAEAAQEVL